MKLRDLTSKFFVISFTPAFLRYSIWRSSAASCYFSTTWNWKGCWCQ